MPPVVCSPQQSHVYDGSGTAHEIVQGEGSEQGDPLTDARPLLFEIGHPACVMRGHFGPPNRTPRTLARTARTLARTARTCGPDSPDSLEGLAICEQHAAPLHSGSCRQRRTKAPQNYSLGQLPYKKATSPSVTRLRHHPPPSNFTLTELRPHWCG